MPDKMLTSKQEKFAQGVAAGLSQADAHRAAYPNQKATDKTIHEGASRLMANGKVSARVAELRQPVIEKMQYGLLEAMAEAADAFRVSMGKDNGSAMVAAVTLRAKLNGLLIEKREVTLTQVQSLDDDTLDRLIALKTAELGLTPGAPVH